MNPQLLRGIFGFIIAFIIIFAGIQVKEYLGGMKDPARSRSARLSARYVKTANVKYEDQQVFISANGRVVSGNTVEIIPEVQGAILRGNISLKTGSRFKKGDLILKIEDREAMLNLQASRSQFTTSLATILPDLKIDFPTHFAKWQSYYNQIDIEKNLPPIPDLTNGKEKTFLSSRNILNQYYSIKSAEKRLSKYRIYAPYKGSISEVFLETGSVVSPGVKIARLIPDGDLEIEIPIKSEDVRLIKTGTTVTITSPNNQDSWSGTIHRISNNLDPATQSINVYAQIKNGKQKVYEGMYLNVEIPGIILPEVMKIPRNAVFDNNRVYVVKDSVLSIVSVDIKNIGSDEVYFSGLNQSSEVVIEPLVNAYEGLRVQKLKPRDK